MGVGLLSLPRQSAYRHSVTSLKLWRWPVALRQVLLPQHTPLPKRRRGWSCGGGVHLNTEHLLGEGVPTPQELASPAGGGCRPPQETHFHYVTDGVTATAPPGGGVPDPPRACATRWGGGSGVFRCTPPPQDHPRRLQRQQSPLPRQLQPLGGVRSSCVRSRRPDLCT